MVVMVLERVSSALRGELTRWFIQPQAGVFVGHVSAIVRDKLWEKILRAKKMGGVIMIHSCNTEQGFTVKTYGETSRRVEDFEGLWLAKTPSAGS